MATTASIDSSSMNCRFCSLWRRPEAWRRQPHSLRCPSPQSRDLFPTWSARLACLSSIAAPKASGRALIKRGVAVFDELRQGMREIETIKDPTIGEVHIGATSTIAEVGIVAAVIGQMSQKYPRINFHVVEATPEWLFHELRERSLDLIILLTFDAVASNDIVSEMLYEDRMVIVAAADNPWTRQSRVELADLVDENWTLPELEHPVTSIVASAFRAIGCEAPRVTATAAPGRIRDTLLATGRFLTVVQESALHFGATLSELKV